MSQDRQESRQLLRRAADAVADTADDRPEPVRAGERGWWQRDPHQWERTGFLDVVEHEYGLVARYWIVALREVALLGLLFWLAAFGVGLWAGERQSVVLLGWKTEVLPVVLGLTVVLRLAVEAAFRVVASRGR